MQHLKQPCNIRLSSGGSDPAIKNTTATATPTLAHQLRNKRKVAIWCQPGPNDVFPQGWYTAKIIDPVAERHNQHLVQFDADASTRVLRLTPAAGQTAQGTHHRWSQAPPPEPPPCPACNSATKGGTGAGGTAAYAYTPIRAKVARLSYTCIKCDKKCTAKTRPPSPERTPTRQGSPSP